MQDYIYKIIYYSVHAYIFMCSILKTHPKFVSINLTKLYYFFKENLAPMIFFIQPG